MERIHLPLIWGHYAHLIEFVALATGHQQHPVLAAKRSTHQPEVHDYTPIGVVIGVKNQCLERLFNPIGWSWNPIHHRLQDGGHAQARLGRTGNRLGAIETNN